jgi:hypothetical protein
MYSTAYVEGYAVRKVRTIRLLPPAFLGDKDGGDEMMDNL